MTCLALLNTTKFEYLLLDHHQVEDRRTDRHIYYYTIDRRSHTLRADKQTGVPLLYYTYYQYAGLTKLLGELGLWLQLPAISINRATYIYHDNSTASSTHV